MALFGQRRHRTSTNAPRDWPAVDVEWTENAAINYVQIGAQLAAGTQLSIAYLEDRLYEDGVLRLPLVVSAGDVRTAVFAYANVDDAAAAHYSAVRARLRQRERMNAVYYASDPILPAKPGSAVEPLQPAHFARAKEERGPAEYALWWPTPEEPRLSASEALPQLDTWFEALDGYGSYLFSAFVDALELAGNEGSGSQLFALPYSAQLFALDGPGQLKLYLHASMETGLWLAFDTHATSPVTRNCLLRLLAASAQELRTAATRQQTPSMPEERGQALAFWRDARNAALSKEESGATTVHIGHIEETTSGRLSVARATTESERRELVAAGRPSEALMARVGEAFDAALKVTSGELDEPGAELPAPDDPDAPPSLSPELSMWRGDTLYTTTFLFTEEPEAIAASPSAITDRAPIDCAVLVCDGYVREGGRRVDALFLRAQERSEPRSHLIVQRYKPLRRGQAFALIGNWTIEGTDVSLFPPEGGAPMPDAGVLPSAAVIGFASELRDQQLKWITIGDPSGAEIYREGQPLSSPTLHLRTPAGTTMTRFAMASAEQAAAPAAQAAAAAADATFAGFVYDDVYRSSGREVRELRFRVQERSASHSFLFAQRYLTPAPGRPFTLDGELHMVAVRESLFAGGSPAPPAPSPARPAPVPPVAPAVSSDPAAVAERRRLELSRVGGGGAESTVRVSLIGDKRAPAGKTTGRPVDLLRFAAFRCSFSESGLTATYQDASSRSLAWSDIASVSVRQLPNDAPWESAIVVDLVSARQPTPLRLLTGTFIAFQTLPGGASTSPLENVRRLCRHVRRLSPGATFDEATARFCDANGPCPRVQGMRQFSDYDARFG